MTDSRARTGFPVYLRLAWRTYFPGPDSPARLTPKRFIVMTALLPALFLTQGLHWLGFFFDAIFFRGHRTLDVKEPLFIVGVPRSGTTFLHRLIAMDADRFTTTQLWELIFAPSITERFLWIGLGKVDHLVGRPLDRLVRALERLSLGQLDAIHGTSLRDPEEDYLGLIPIAACFILTLPFPFRDELWALSRFDTEMPEEDKRRVMRYYKRLVQRHLYVHGREKQYLSKNPSFTSLIGALDETFPDCKIIGCVRTPYKVVPSLLSSMAAGAEIFDNDPQGTTYRDDLVAML